MNASQMQSLIQALTGRALTLSIEGDTQIPLDSKVGVYRAGYPYNPAKNRYPHFEWKTPKDEDNLIRSFITSFCTKYKEPNPATYFDYDGKANFDRYAEGWNNLETRHDSPCWNHHCTHMLSKDTLREQIGFNSANFTTTQSRLCFYPTVYGIGIFTLLGGKWVTDSLAEMAAHLKANGIPYRNELSKAHWVTRFVIGATKEMHTQLLATI